MPGEKPQTDDVWAKEGLIAIGRALLQSHPAPMSAAELASAMGRDPSNTKRAADALVEAGGLTYAKPQQVEDRAGRKTQSAFVFAAGERDRFLRLFGKPGPEDLRQGQQVVFVDASVIDNDLLGCLARTELLARASWSALCDGARQELVIAFDGPAAVETSLDLMAALSAAKIAATRATVAKVDGSAELLRWVRRGHKNAQ
jgi:hypothetical protein